MLEKDSQDTDSEEDMMYAANENQLTIKSLFGSGLRGLNNVLLGRDNNDVNRISEEVPESTLKFDLAGLFLKDDDNDETVYRNTSVNVANDEQPTLRALDTLIDDGASDNGVNFK